MTPQRDNRVKVSGFLRADSPSNGIPLAAHNSLTTTACTSVTPLPSSLSFLIA